MSDSDTLGFFVSRQPIVAGERRLVGWELAFGSASGELLSGSKQHADEHVAAVLAFAKTAKWDSLLCGGRALLPADRRLIFSDALEHMPHNRCLLGISPLDEIDASLSNRLYDLHSRRGIRLLFFGYSRRDPREQLLELADIVEIDAFGDEDSRALLVRRARRRNLRVLAASVENDADFIRIRAFGFELFSGQSYAEASDDKETQATAEGKVLLQILVEARGELEIDRVARSVKAAPALEEGLLRLVNSLELARAQKIENVGQALMMIGAKGLGRWLNLLLFQVGSKNGTRGALFRVAASRARLMELLVGSSGTAGDPAVKARGESAFLVGILSFVHVLFGVSRQAAISGLDLPDEMMRALLTREGGLGRLLRLAECLDTGEFVEAAEISSELSLSPQTIWHQQGESYDWVMRMI